MTTALEGGEGSASRPGFSLPSGKNRYQLYRRLEAYMRGHLSNTAKFIPLDSSVNIVTRLRAGAAGESEFDTQK